MGRGACREMYSFVSRTKAWIYINIHNGVEEFEMTDAVHLHHVCIGYLGRFGPPGIIRGENTEIESEQVVVVFDSVDDLKHAPQKVGRVGSCKVFVTGIQDAVFTQNNHDVDSD
jgi:hypothetical protein